MTGMANQLNRLMPTLSARERFLLDLRALRAGDPLDPSFRTSMPRDQVAEFGRLIDLYNAVNISFGSYVRAFQLVADKMHLRFVWWHSITAIGLTAWELARLVPVGKRQK